MSVYRRRVMQVKHPPNQITAIYDVTTTSSATTLYQTNYFTYGVTFVKEMIIDGEKIANVGTKNTHKFATLGKHEVKFIVKEDKPYTGRYLFGKTNITKIDFSELRSSFSSIEEIFKGCGSLVEVKGLNTAGYSSLYGVFNGCKNLRKINIKWDLSKTTSLQRTFYNCAALTNIDVGDWDTSGVTTLSEAFYGCSALQSLDASKWDLSKTTSLQRTFYNCAALTNIDVGDWDTSGVTTLSEAFYGCSALQSLDVSGWDLSKVTSAEQFLQGCTNLKSLTLGQMRLPLSGTAKLDGMFGGVTLPLDVSSLIIGGSLRGIFRGYSGTSLVGLDKWDTSSVKTLYGIFWGCSNLSDFEGIRNWNTSQVTDMSYLFYEQNRATNYPVEDWDVSNVTTLVGAFYDSFHLTSLDLTKWDVSKVTTIERLFGFTMSRTENLPQVDLSTWNLEKCEKMDSAFSYRSFNLILPEGFGKNCKSFNGTFMRYRKLSTLDLTKIDTSSAEDTTSMFYEVGTILDLTSWDLSKVKTWSKMFSNNMSLAELRLNTEISEEATLLTWTNTDGVFKNSIGSGSGVDGAKLYYYPHPSFVEKFLPIVPDKWEKIDITTLTE